MIDDSTGSQKPTDQPDESTDKGTATIDSGIGYSLERGGSSIQQLQEASDNPIRVSRRPDGSKALVTIGGTDDIVRTTRDTSPDGTPIALKLAVGYDADIATVTLSPTMLEDLIEQLEAHRDAFEEAGRL